MQPLITVRCVKALRNIMAALARSQCRTASCTCPAPARQRAPRVARGRCYPRCVPGARFDRAVQGLCSCTMQVAHALGRITPLVTRRDLAILVTQLSAHIMPINTYAEDWVGVLKAEVGCMQRARLHRAIDPNCSTNLQLCTVKQLGQVRIWRLCSLSDLRSCCKRLAPCCAATPPKLVFPKRFHFCEICGDRHCHASDAVQAALATAYRNCHVKMQRVQSPLQRMGAGQWSALSATAPAQWSPRHARLAHCDHAFHCLMKQSHDPSARGRTWCQRAGCACSLAEPASCSMSARHGATSAAARCKDRVTFIEQVSQDGVLTLVKYAPHPQRLVGAALQGVVPCPLCAGYEDVMQPPDPDRPAGDADEPHQLSDDADDGDNLRRFGKVDISRAGHGW
jgi:hypothetical protein